VGIVKVAMRTEGWKDGKEEMDDVRKIFPTISRTNKKQKK